MLYKHTFQKYKNNKMDITIIILTVGLLTYYFFRKQNQKKKMKKIELSAIDKEEITKLEKLAGKRLPYRYSNQRQLTFQIIELVRPGYIKRRIFDNKGHCHYLIKYYLDRSVAELVEFGITDGHYWRKTKWDKEPKVIYHYGKKEFSNFDKITQNFRYYSSIVKAGRDRILPLENDLNQYVNELENHANYQKAWVTRNHINDSQAIHAISTVEKINLDSKRGIKRGLALQNILRIRAINSGFKVYNQKVNSFQNRMTELHLDQIKSLHQMDILSSRDLRHLSNLLAGAAAEKLVNLRLREVQTGKGIIHNLLLPYPYEHQNSLGTNQIDHVVITSNGIFCLETKARTSQNEQYNVLTDYNEVADQVAKHKESIKYVLEKSNNPVIINLLKRLSNIDRLVKNVVVFVSRTEDEVTLVNTERYEKMGITVVQVADIQSLLIKAENKIGLQPEEIAAIKEELDNNKQLQEEKAYQENAVLFEDQGLTLNQKQVEEQLYHANQVIKHLDQIDALLADYLQEAREWQKQYRKYCYWKKFYEQVHNFIDQGQYYRMHNLKKDIFDKI